MFDSAFDCSFSDCLVPCAITFVIVMVLMGVLHIWIYFKLVKLAKERYSEHFTSTPAVTASKKSQLDVAFQDPYPGITQLENVQEEELWRLYLIEKKKQGKTAVFPIESKYFNNLSSKFLRSKGYTDKQINNYRVIGAKLSKGWTI